MNQPVSRWIVGWIVILTLMGAGSPGKTRAEDLRARVRLDYQNMSRPGWNSSLLLQEYNVTTSDELFMKNLLTINLRWNRMDDFLTHQGVNKTRLRLGLRGTAYDATLLYTPAFYPSVEARLSGQKTDNFLATWQYRPGGHPQLRFEYRESKRTMPDGDIRKVVTASRQRMLQMSHDIGPLKIGASYRVRNSSGSFASSDRTISTGMMRAGINKQFGRILKTDLAVDYQRTDTDQYGRTDLSRTANLRFGAMWTPSRKMMASVGGSLRDLVNNRGDEAHSVTNNRELIARCMYRPTSTVQLEMRRDVRRNRGALQTLYSDILRMQASYTGAIRKGLQGRVNFVKNATIRTENVATPSDNLDMTLDFKLYRRTTMRTTLAMSRYQHKDSTFLARYSSLGTVEIRSRLTRRLVTNLTFRTTDVSPEVTFLGADVYNMSAGLNYTSPRGLTFSGTARRTILAQSLVAPQTSFSSSLALRFNPAITLTLDGSWNESGTLLGTSSATTFNTRLQLRLGQNTNAVIGYQQGNPSTGLENHSVTASLTANF